MKRLHDIARRRAALREEAALARSALAAGIGRARASSGLGIPLALSLLLSRHFAWETLLPLAIGAWRWLRRRRTTRRERRA